MPCQLMLHSLQTVQDIFRLTNQNAPLLIIQRVRHE